MLQTSLCPLSFLIFRLYILFMRQYLLLVYMIFASMQFNSAQESIRLNENWDFVRNDLGNIWEAIRPYSQGSSESVPIWQKITLPHCYNATDAVAPFENYYQGPAWYRNTLAIRNPYPNGRTLLHFEGAGQKTKVYLYDQLVGEHVGGYDEWTVDITEAVKAFEANPAFQKQYKGRYPLIIRTDNSRDTEMIPSDLSDFNIYGGIYRYLNLLYLPAVSVGQVFATPTYDLVSKSAHIAVSLRLYMQTEPTKGDITVELTAPDGKTVYKNTSSQSLNKEITLPGIRLQKPKLWSPDQPNRYTLHIQGNYNGQTFRHSTAIGIRHFEFADNGPFRLNGERLLLRGTHRHEDHAGVGAAMTEEMMLQEMKMMKDMGVNFIRLGHYQQSRIILNACDSLGILVWEEIPWCRGGLGGPVYQEQSKRMLRNMIEQHYNHPSIILWGMGNENDWPNDFPTFDRQQIRAFMQELHNLSHSLDDTRKTAIRRCDFCKDIVDVYSPSIWAGWYRGQYTDYKSVSEAEFKQVPHFIHAEWGGDSHARRHDENPDNGLTRLTSSTSADERAGDASLYGGATRASKDGNWSESYICNLIDWHLKEQEHMPWLTGSAYWPFKDFSTPVRPDNPVPYVNQKGVVERDFTKKESYYVFQSYWTKDLMAHIYGHSWPIRWGEADEQKMIKVYSNADEAELFLNGKSLGTKKRNSADFPAAGLRWNTVFREGENHIRVIAKKGKQTVTDEINQLYQTKKWSKPADIITKTSKLSDDEVLAEVQLTDAEGTACLDAKDYVLFELAGDGVLVQDQGTSSGSRYLQAFNGRAMIKIRKNKGSSVLAVKVKGLETAFVTIK